MAKSTDNLEVEHRLLTVSEIKHLTSVKPVLEIPDLVQVLQRVDRALLQSEGKKSSMGSRVWSRN